MAAAQDALKEGIEWMPDDFSPGCLICNNPWTLKNRRHHCRRCGRLVCKDCSTRTMKFDEQKELQRVCDECFDTIELKRQMQMEANYQRERELALLNATSKVSDSLCRIYFLDGSFKTVYYDETVTAQDITAKICFSVKIALFEVERDLKDSTQFVLVPAEECIGDIIVRWGHNNQDSAKLVVPIYDVSSSMRGKAPPSLINSHGSSFPSQPSIAPHLSSSIGAAGLQDLASNPVTSRHSMAYQRGVSFSMDQSGHNRSSLSHASAADKASVMITPERPHPPINKRSSFSFFSSSKPTTHTESPGSNAADATYHPDAGGSPAAGTDLFGEGNGGGSMDAHVVALLTKTNKQQAEEANTLRKELADLRKKYNILRSIHVKREKSERAKAKRDATPMITNSHLAVPPTADTSDHDGTTAADTHSNDTTDHADAPTDSVVDDDDHDDSADNKTGKDSSVVIHQGILKKKNYFNKHFTPFYFVLRGDGRLYWYKKESDIHKKNGHSGRYDVRKCRCKVDPTDYKNLSITMTGKKITAISATDIESLEWVKVLSENSVAHGFASAGTIKVAAKNITSNDPTVLAAQATASEKDDITTVMKQSSSKQVKVFLDKVSDMELFFGRFDEVIYASFEHGVSDPQQMFHTYEIISAMQSLYGAVMHFGEQWSHDTREWLLGMLRQKMSLPIEEPELLMAVIQCLTRENMLFSPETVNAVNQVIEMSFEQGTDPNSDSTIEGVLNSVNRMVETLDQVVEDLMPLLPEDFNVITMFQEKANRKIKNDIKTFYTTHKDDMNNRDLLTLLSFADSQTHILQKFGVDTRIISELNTDLLRQYTNVTAKLMKTWIGRIHEADIKPDSECNVSEGVGMCTHWPGDLMACVGEHVNLAVQELTIHASEKVICVMLDICPDFISLQRVWADTIGKTCPPERMCAYVNNMSRFAFLLADRLELIEDDIGESEVIYDAFMVTIQCFKDEAERGVNILVGIVSADFKDGLAGGLFVDDWAESRQVVDTLHVTLQEYVQDLKIWLVDDTYIKRILLGVLKVVANTYLETLLTFGLLVVGNVGERLTQDYQVILQAFYACNQWVHQDAVDRETKPLRDTIEVLRMDLRRMAQFVRTDFYLDFGSNYMKIWQTLMAMRDESRQVHDAVYEAIMKGWVPATVSAFCDVPYVDKLKAPHHKNRISMRMHK